MTNLCRGLSSALSSLQRSYACHRTADPRTVTVTSSRHYTDGDAVEVFVRISADGLRVAVSDGGMSLARRDLYAASDLKGTSRTLWDDILEDHGVKEFDGRIYSTGPMEAAEFLIAQIADVALVLDAVRLLAAGERKTFARKLQSWLQEEDGIVVRPEASVIDEFGNEQRVTAIVESEQGEILVQGSGGKSVTELRKNAEHALWIFSFVKASEWPMAKRLIVLERSTLGTDAQRNATQGMLNRLTTVSNVAAFDSKYTVSQFLHRGPSQHADMVTNGYSQMSFPF